MSNAKKLNIFFWGKQLYLMFILLLFIISSCQRHLSLSKKLKDEDYKLTEIKVTDMKIEALAQDYVVVNYEFNHEGELVKASKKFKDNRNIFLFSRQFPAGSRFKMVYDAYLPNLSEYHFFILHLPIYDSILKFSRTEGEVESVSFYLFKNDIFYGGCHIVYSYFVNNKHYFGHKGLDLKNDYPKIEKPKKELDFEGKKFVVEYDADNPQVSRILLDEEVGMSINSK